jgi:hypothetical protein
MGLIGNINDPKKGRWQWGTLLSIFIRHYENVAIHNLPRHWQGGVNRGGIGWVPVKAADKLGVAHIGYVEDDEPSMPIAHVEPVSLTYRMMAPVRVAIPVRLLPSGGPLSGHPPSSDFLRPCRIFEIDNHYDVADVTFKSRRQISVSAIGCKSVHAFAGGFEKRNFARLCPIRDVEDFEARLGFFFGLVSFIVNQHHFTADPHFVRMNSFRHFKLRDQLRVLWIMDVDNGSSIGRIDMADIGVAIFYRH